VGLFQVAHVEDHVVHSTGCLGLGHGILRGGASSAGNRDPYGNTEPPLVTGVR
jgi:hypothetical protein